MGFKNFSQKHQSANQTKMVEQLYEKYKDKNQDELLNELFKQVQEQKQNGTFDYNSLNQMAKTMAPFLSQEQNIRIKELLEKIK